MSYTNNNGPYWVRVLTITLPCLCASLFPFLAAAESATASYWGGHNQANTAVIDHKPWQQFLDNYLHHALDGTTQVDYQGAREHGQELLASYLNSLRHIDPTEFNRNEQFAFWVNLYNALTVQVVLDNPGKSSIRKMGKGWFSSGPWKDEAIHINGKPLTLDNIEHDILRPLWADHRIHFVVNCASVGCPDLPERAMLSTELEKQLAAAEVAFITHPKGVAWNQAGELQLSSIFEWYQADFAENETELRQYLIDVLQKADATEAAAVVAAYQGDIEYDYDWALNGLTNAP